MFQTFATYIAGTGGLSILDVVVGGQTARVRLDHALRYLVTSRLDPSHGLLWGGTTVDWGDVQAGAPQATSLAVGSRRAIDIYPNAMFSLALRDFIAFSKSTVSTTAFWSRQRAALDASIGRWLWDAEAHKYRAHLYLDGSPFLPSFDESAVFVHSGTAVAIEAGLLSDKEIHVSLAHMDADVAAAIPVRSG